MYKKVPFYFLIIVLFFSCETVDSSEIEELEETMETEIVNPIENDPIPSNMNCTFVQIDSTEDGLIDDVEKMLMETCRLNQFTSESEALNNLIGEWELIGHGEGWFPYPSLPCSYLTISSEELIFEFTSEYVDTISLHTWEVFELTSSEVFRMKILPPLPNNVYLDYFSSNYLYGDRTLGDGNMYLYEKVK